VRSPITVPRCSIDFPSDLLSSEIYSAVTHGLHILPGSEAVGSLTCCHFIHIEALGLWLLRVP
jgi:hypothetical protein